MTRNGREEPAGDEDEPGTQDSGEPLFQPLDPVVLSTDLGQRIRGLRHGQGLTLGDGFHNAAA